jgi:Rhodopirellula transposase DDE domain
LRVTADGGGSNGSRVRLWKRELRRQSNELGIDIRVHHLPPHTSKWNKIEHRLFSFISMNWRARPLVSYQVIIDLISATTTDAGLTVHCELDETACPDDRRNPRLGHSSAFRRSNRYPASHSSAPAPATPNARAS